MEIVTGTWLHWSRRCTSRARLEGKTAIVTGANSGLGKETALDFCRRGCRVIMACRDMKRANEAKDDIMGKLAGEANVGELVVQQLDLASLSSIRAFADAVMANESSIHILINNAGVGGVPKGLTPDGFELHFGINYLGHFYLTLLLLPRIIKSAPARIVNVSSYLYMLGWLNFKDLQNQNSFYWAPRCYGRSKLAQILFTKELASRLSSTGVTVTSVNPGLVDTDVFRYYSTAFPIVKPAMDLIMRSFFKTAELGAQTQIFCAVDETVDEHNGKFFVDCKPTPVLPKARDPVTASKLWHISWDLLNFGDFEPFAPM